MATFNLVMPRSVLTKAVAISLLVHAGIVVLLSLEAWRRPIYSDAPLRVRILEPPPPQGTAASPPQPPPAAESRPKAGRQPIEIPHPSVRPAQPQAPMVTERLAPRSIPVPDTPTLPEKPPVAEKPVAPAPPPQIATAPLPEPTAPASPRVPEPSRQSPAPPPPERGGLIMGGPPQGAPPLLGSRGSPPAGVGPGRPSIRDQIASLGSGLTEDGGGPAKRTVSLDSREGQYVDYLGHLKWRVQRVWDYPQEAVRNGISGDLLIVFTLNKSGSLIFIRLVRSSGYPILDEEALRAIKTAAPFDPFPPQMGDEPLNINGMFYYNLPRHIRKN